MTRRLEDESGYSMVEVLAAIVILSLAILPMISMFDAGLRAASAGGNYDQARALANSELEEARITQFSELSSLSSACPEDGFPGCNSVQTQTTGVRLQGSGDTRTIVPDDEDPPEMMRVTVTVSWGGEGSGKSYSATGIVSR